MKTQHERAADAEKAPYFPPAAKPTRLRNRRPLPEPEGRMVVRLSGKGMSGKGMRCLNIPLPDIPLPFLPGALAHLHDGFGELRQVPRAVFDVDGHHVAACGHAG